MASKIKVDTLETANGSGTIALSNQLSGMTTASLPTLTSAEMPAGSVLQMISATQDGTSAVTSTSSSYVTTGLSKAITPRSTSSKIKIDASFFADANSNGCNIYFQMKRGSTSLGGSTQDGNTGIALVSNTRLLMGMNISYLDSPSTTSAVTYELFMKVAGGTVVYKPDQILSSLILTEIQG